MAKVTMPDAATGMTPVAVATFAMTDGAARYHTRNQAEYGIPTTSVWGQWFRRLVTGNSGPVARDPSSVSHGRLVPSMASAHRLGVPQDGGIAGGGAPHSSSSGTQNQAGLVNMQPGLYYPIGIRVRGQIGVNVVRAARAVPLYRAGGYAGQLPMSQQPQLIKPVPWADPTRGQP